MIIRRCTYSDVPSLVDIYRQARQIQLDSGNLHQWPEGYPSESDIIKDIDRGVSYAVEDKGAIVGAFAFISGEDPTYKLIEDGHWLDNTLPYSTIHRLGSLPSSKGVAKACFDWCWEKCKNLRVDTHRDNAIMRHCIEKAGFIYCGVIHLLNGDSRMAYQKIYKY